MNASPSASDSDVRAQLARKEGRSGFPWLSLLGLAIAIVALVRAFDEARPLRVTDGNGIIRASLQVEDATVALVLRDGSGKVRARLAVDEAGPAQLSLLGEDGADEVSLSTASGRASLRVVSAENTLEIQATESGSHLRVSSESTSAVVASSPLVSQVILTGPGQRDEPSRLTLESVSQGTRLDMSVGGDSAALSVSPERSQLSLGNGQRSARLFTEPAGSVLRFESPVPDLDNQVVLTTRPGERSRLPRTTHLGESSVSRTPATP